MEIKARGVDPIAVKKIDELARKQGVSRSAFIANMIQNYAAVEIFSGYEERYQDIINKVIRIVQQNTDVQKKVLEIVGE